MKAFDGADFDSAWDALGQPMFLDLNMPTNLISFHDMTRSPSFVDFASPKKLRAHQHRPSPRSVKINKHQFPLEERRIEMKPIANATPQTTRHSAKGTDESTASTPIVSRTNVNNRRSPIKSVALKSPIKSPRRNITVTTSPWADTATQRALISFSPAPRSPAKRDSPRKASHFGNENALLSFSPVQKSPAKRQPLSPKSTVGASPMKQRGSPRSSPLKSPSINKAAHSEPLLVAAFKSPNQRNKSEQVHHVQPLFKSPAPKTSARSPMSFKSPKATDVNSLARSPGLRSPFKELQLTSPTGAKRNRASPVAARPFIKDATDPFAALIKPSTSSGAKCIFD
jgi:hypothetical protein